MRYSDLPPGVSIFDEHINPSDELLCPQCSSANTQWYSGALGYEAIRCRDCKTETDANNQSSHCPWPEVTK